MIWISRLNARAWCVLEWAPFWFCLPPPTAPTLCRIWSFSQKQWGWRTQCLHFRWLTSDNKKFTFSYPHTFGRRDFLFTKGVFVQNSLKLLVGFWLSHIAFYIIRYRRILFLKNFMGNSINFNVACEKNLVFYIKCEKADMGVSKCVWFCFLARKALK